MVEEKVELESVDLQQALKIAREEIKILKTEALSSVVCLFFKVSSVIGF